MANCYLPGELCERADLMIMNILGHYIYCYKNSYEIKRFIFKASVFHLPHIYYFNYRHYTGKKNGSKLVIYPIKQVNMHKFH